MCRWFGLRTSPSTEVEEGDEGQEEDSAANRDADDERCGEVKGSSGIRGDWSGRCD
jgi:hypothetical protein